MKPNDFTLPRKLSTNDQGQTTMEPSSQFSPMHNNPSQLTTQTEQSHFQAASIDKLSLEGLGSCISSQKDQEKGETDRFEERNTAKLELNIGHRRELGMTKSEVLSPIGFASSQNQNIFDSGRDSQTEPENSHKVFEKYLEVYQRKFPSDIQHLRTSKQISSPESKKSGQFAFRRICNNNSLGETLVSEFIIQDQLHDKESHSKSSKSSNENLVNLSPENTESPDQVLRNKQQPQNADIRRANEIREIDSSISAMSEEKMLKDSDLQALIRKKDKQLKRPVRFNVMVVGESGLGKSTFVDCFLESAYNITNVIRDSTHQIQEKEGVRTYKGITLQITMIDTPGYTHTMNIEDWYKSLKKNITDRFLAYKEEKKKRRKDKNLATKAIEDRRVHIILYFLSGPRIRGRDIQLMKNLRKYCSIIPVLAKGDSYTIEEIKELKTQIIAKAYNHKLEWFDFAEALRENPDKLNELNNSKLGPCPPFLIISSVNKVEIGPNEFVYGRKYEYGTCNIENPSHSDFKLLQTLLGGHICLEAINLVDECYYKMFHQKIKEKEKKEKEDDATKTIAIGSAVAIGILGGLIAFRKKLGF